MSAHNYNQRYLAHYTEAILDIVNCRKASDIHSVSELSIPVVQVPTVFI